MVLSFIITLLVGVWLSIKFKGWYQERARMLYLASKLPGPPTIPLLGNALQFACGPEGKYFFYIPIYNLELNKTVKSP